MRLFLSPALEFHDHISQLSVNDQLYRPFIPERRI
jgi:hypothetical protein